MQKIVLSIFASALLFMSCGNTNIDNKKIPDSKTAALQQYEDASYLAKVYGSFVTENELQNIALQKSKDPNILALAKELLQEYSDLNKKIEAVAATKQLTLDPKLRFDQENHIDFLQKENAETFDREYINILLRQHQKFIKDFKLTGIDSNDEATQTIATEILDVITKNYQQISAEDDRLKQ